MSSTPIQRRRRGAVALVAVIAGLGVAVPATASLGGESSGSSTTGAAPVQQQEQAPEGQDRQRDGDCPERDGGSSSRDSATEL